MSSSELSDALNPYYSQSRSSRSLNLDYSDTFDPAAQPTRQHIAHQSELKLAISDSTPVSQLQQSSDGLLSVQEFLRVVTHTNQTHEAERKRRLEWEHEQEERYAQRQAELERQMLEMRQEIHLLRSAVAGGSNTTSDSVSPPSLIVSTSHLDTSVPLNFNLQNSTPHYSPISPISQSPDSFVQGSSTLRPPHDSYTPDAFAYPISFPSQFGSPASEPMLSTSVSPSVSPMLASERIPSHSSILSPNLLSSQPRKRQKTREDADDRGDEPDHSTDDKSCEIFIHGRNYYEKKCHTIQQAMRSHILRLMNVEGDHNLPDSHSEGAVINPSQSLRLVWDKTIKQSVHNSRMKTFVVADIEQNRRLYQHVPEKDFAKKTLETVFEQCYTTLRQRFKSQRDLREAESMKVRAEERAQKARRSSRRKNKLSSRSAARNNMPKFEHVTFDGALDIDCMSSEESDVEAESSQPKCVYTRGYLWRSNRLLRFFSALDEEDKASGAGVPKRGSAKMTRAIGPPKVQGVTLPPQGVASWMISRRWVRATLGKRPDLAEALKRLVYDGSSDFPWDTFHDLGEATDEEVDEQQLQYSGPYSSSSLRNALD